MGSSSPLHRAARPFTQGDAASAGSSVLCRAAGGAAHRHDGRRRRLEPCASHSTRRCDAHARGLLARALVLLLTPSLVHASSIVTSWSKVDAGSVVPPNSADVDAQAYEGQLLHYGGGEAFRIHGHEIKPIHCLEAVWLLRNGYRWERLDSPPLPVDLSEGRYGAGKGVYGHELFIYGGSGPLPALTIWGDVWAFHLQLRSWRQVMASSAPGSRYRVLSEVLGDRMYVYGGARSYRAGGAAHDSLQDMWYLDLVSETWSELQATQPWSAADLNTMGTTRAIIQLGEHPYFVQVGNKKLDNNRSLLGDLRLLRLDQESSVGEALQSPLAWQIATCDGGDHFRDSVGYRYLCGIPRRSAQQFGAQRNAAHCWRVWWLWDCETILGGRHLPRALCFHTCA